MPLWTDLKKDLGESACTKSELDALCAASTLIIKERNVALAKV